MNVQVALVRLLHLLEYCPYGAHVLHRSETMRVQLWLRFEADSKNHHNCQLPYCFTRSPPDPPARAPRCSIVDSPYFLSKGEDKGFIYIQGYGIYIDPWM